MPYIYETHMHTDQASACGRSPGRDYIKRYIDAGYTPRFERGGWKLERDARHEWGGRLRSNRRSRCRDPAVLTQCRCNCADEVGGSGRRSRETGKEGRPQEGRRKEGRRKEGENDVARGTRSR